MTNEEKEKLRFVSKSEGTVIVGHICDECVYKKGKFSTFGAYPSVCCFEKTDKCSDKNPYYVFIEKDKSNVIVFSKFRVPFDIPKHKLQNISIYKNDLISAIKNLEASDNCILQARYGALEKKSFYDVENVLFYNIGITNFKFLTTQGVRFSTVDDKEIEKIRKKYNIPDTYSHYYEYRVIPNEREDVFNNLIADWENVPLKCLGIKPVDSWRAIRAEQEKIRVYDKIDCDKGDTFALMLNIEKPKGNQFNIMTAMKPLLDGLICAFHNSQFSESEIEYFSQQLNCEKEILTDHIMNVLGERKSKFIQKYRDGVKWNPADDLCSYVCISIMEGNSWNISGKLYSSVKCPNCGKKQLSKLLWGMPAFTEELERDIKAGKIKLAGCCVDDSAQRYYCKWCKTKF